jgi:hypothetical protein
MARVLRLRSGQALKARGKSPLKPKAGLSGPPAKKIPAQAELERGTRDWDGGLVLAAGEGQGQQRFLLHFVGSGGSG